MELGGKVQGGVGGGEDCALLIHDLTMTYPASVLGGTPKHAVRGISLACSDGERFGLLGINGAGKTTTLGILTGDLTPTSGEVFIGGKPLSDPATMSLMGYCPQVDPLLDLMTAYETLWFFGRIRGIPADVLTVRVHDLVRQVGLLRFAHKPCGTYSGGNKRKLSLAVALVGDPRVLFLDEPSTGMDPEARRNMWTVIEQVSARRSVILVSHSMEEVEALCTRMCVMVSGRLQCIGSSQHLKSRFGLGYQVEVRSKPACVDAVVHLCKQVLPSAEVQEVHGGYVRLRTSQDVDLAEAFRALEGNKARLQILDYSISQCTLEQVFIQFAKQQEEETGGGGFSGGDVGGGTEDTRRGGSDMGSGGSGSGDVSRFEEESPMSRDSNMQAHMSVIAPSSAVVLEGEGEGEEKDGIEGKQAHL
ncbi:P-loop containing nucleoside triphosphate hydrolase protein [Ochromonadaceae sp. CCMP2298]|nr:P-loop containing nucleoside triphosphate hydrolase protein [Ochromonadaceae sp. CCMP2298]